MTNGIEPSGFFTRQVGMGGVNPQFNYLLDPNNPAGAYRALLRGNLLPADVGNYDFITKTSPLVGDSKFAGLFPVPSEEGLVTLGAGAIFPPAGIAVRAAIADRNKKALQTLENQGILTLEDEGKYRIAPELEEKIVESELSPKDFFREQYDKEFGAANELAQYLDQVAFSTQGNFFQKDFFGNPTPYAKYVDRQGNIRPDALEKWKQFGEEDKKGFLKIFEPRETKDPEPQPTKQDKGTDMPQGGGGLDSLVGVSEPRGRAPDFLDTPSGRFDPKGRRLAGGTTNLLLG